MPLYRPIKEEKNENKPHKCGLCKKVRYEKFMVKTIFKTAWEKDVWLCKDHLKTNDPGFRTWFNYFSYKYK